jgi:hypothetical protein
MSQANKLTGRKDRAPSKDKGKDIKMSEDEIYKTGVWYAWTGGKCPVHRKSRVNVILRGDDLEREILGRDKAHTSMVAGLLIWDVDGGDGDIVAFRVVSEFDLRTWWIYDTVDYATLGEAMAARARDRLNGYDGGHIREVTELPDE